MDNEQLVTALEAKVAELKAKVADLEKKALTDQQMARLQSLLS